jgi:predicted ATPase
MLKEDAANLAPVLARLREVKPRHYQLIVETIRQALPFFADFVLEPEYGKLYLRWREVGTDTIFGAHQASDGMLRTLALITLLLQPIESLPSLIILDEPELGLHPYAIQIIAGLLKSVARERQVIIATQSATLLEEFDPEDVVVVERNGRRSDFHRLESEPLAQWLKSYSLGELWNKNVLGGRPREGAA